MSQKKEPRGEESERDVEERVIDADREASAFGRCPADGFDAEAGIDQRIAEAGYDIELTAVGDRRAYRLGMPG